MRTAIYPGSFDPFTNGHLDVVQRAAKLFDRVIVAVAKNEGKHPFFHPGGTPGPGGAIRPADCRMSKRTSSTACWWIMCSIVRPRQSLRGLRAISDFEFEFQLALMNRKLNEKFETIFMMPKDTYTFLSSRIVKEIARLGGDVSAFVPAARASCACGQACGEKKA